MLKSRCYHFSDATIHQHYFKIEFMDFISEEIFKFLSNRGLQDS